MLYFMAMVKHSSRYFRDQDIKVIESHQASKRTKPGTAIYLAKSLEIPETEIRSERDPKIQNERLGIPSSFLDRHAYHEIVIRSPEAEIRLETRVLGKSAYASGLSKIIDIVAERKLAPGYYDIVDLIIAD
jgi:dihydrodipicolinate reductase